VNVIDLQTVKASRSFFKLYNLLRKEKTVVVFCTGGQINLLVGMISVLLKGTKLIARPTNQDNSEFLSLKAKALGIFFTEIYKRFDIVVCQSGEIRAHVEEKHQISPSKIRVIPNPVVLNEVKRPVLKENDHKKLIVVARLTQQKGISRLLDIMSGLPENYHLTIVGDGVLKSEIEDKIVALNLSGRVKMLVM
jgi:glycosyltransferase involved in cell wall biosynthesis